MAMTSTKIPWENSDKLAAYLGFASKIEMRSFVENSKHFQPFFSQFLKKVILPEQEEAQRTKKARPRGTQLRSVQICMYAGEGGGKCKYSERFPEFGDYTTMDWNAWFLLNARDANTNSIYGIFYGKVLSDSETEARIWGLLKNHSYNYAPARKATSSMPSEETKARCIEEEEGCENSICT